MLTELQYHNLIKLGSLLTVDAFHYFLKDYSLGYVETNAYSDAKISLFGNSWLNSAVGFAAYHSLASSKFPNEIFRYGLGDPSIKNPIQAITLGKDGDTVKLGSTAVEYTFGEEFVNRVYLGNGNPSSHISVKDYVKYAKDTIADILYNDENTVLTAEETTSEPEQAGEVATAPYIYSRTMFDHNVANLKLIDAYFHATRIELNNRLKNASIDMVESVQFNPHLSFSIADMDKLSLDGYDIPKDRMQIQSAALRKILATYAGNGWNIALTKDAANPTLVFKL